MFSLRLLYYPSLLPRQLLVFLSPSTLSSTHYIHLLPFYFFRPSFSFHVFIVVTSLLSYPPLLFFILFILPSSEYVSHAFISLSPSLYSRLFPSHAFTLLFPRPYCLPQTELFPSSNTSHAKTYLLSLTPVPPH